MADPELQLDRLWKFEDVARFLAVSEVHVRRMVSQRRIPSLKICGSRRFDPHAILSWVQSHEESA